MADVSAIPIVRGFGGFPACFTRDAVKASLRRLWLPTVLTPIIEMAGEALLFLAPNRIGARLRRDAFLTVCGPAWIAGDVRGRGARFTSGEITAPVFRPALSGVKISMAPR